MVCIILLFEYLVMSQAWQLGERKGEGKGNCEHLGKRSRSNKFAGFATLPSSLCSFERVYL